MSLNQKELKRHCETIMASRRIRGKIVVLCEGYPSRDGGRPSPQTYRKMEKCPDANFYKACVWWSQHKPVFFNCGDRKDVLDTYRTLADWHSESQPPDSHLDPARLFAIVDLDIQVQKIEDCEFSDTEAIFHDLYDGMNVNEMNASRHRIWVTGLIHKEAYFLIPEIQAAFDDPLSLCPTYNGAPLRLEEIHLAICDETTQDEDLRDNLRRACDRIRHCAGLDRSDTIFMVDNLSLRRRNNVGD